MGTAFTSELDILNRAMQHCGVQRIASLVEDSLQAGEAVFVYDKVRRAELRRNVWAFATRKAALRPVASGVMFLNPSVWANSITYAYGDIVVDSNNIPWASRAMRNVGNIPGASSQWEIYSGPLTVNAYDTTGTTSYFAGELVYKAPGDGSYLVWMSLLNGNSQDPCAPTEWDADTQYSKDNIVVYYPAWSIGTTYAAGNVVSYMDNDYISLSSGNTGNNPAGSSLWAEINLSLAPPYYSALTAYTQGMMVTYSGVNYIALQATTGNVPSSSPTYWLAQQAGTNYISLVDFNSNNNPSSSPSQWSSTIPYPVSADTWTQIACTLTDLLVVYPLGSGPVNQSFTRNAYRLPANYLRRAPQDPKAGSSSYLGAVTGSLYDDWVLENNFIVTQEVWPIVLRFVADVQDVTTMDDMFCEGLALRIAMEIVERLTQSSAKMATIVGAYKLLMTEARTVNGIETDSEEPPVDDYIACRV